MKVCICAAAIAAASALAHANVVHDESVDGDLSDDNLNPTIVNVSLGSNIITGTTEPIGPTFDPDFWTIVIPVGAVLSEITFVEYNAPIGQNSFFLVEAGGQVSSTGDSSGALGSALIGSIPGSEQGQDVLDDLGEANLGGSGFTGSLGPGTYTFWYQETGDATGYSFDFVVKVPAPATTAALAAIGFMGLRRRR